MENFSVVNMRLVYPLSRISAEVQRLADEISADYEGKELLLLVVLKGAFIFAADLVRRISIPVKLDFIRLSSYSGTESTGEVIMVNDVTETLAEQHVLIIEDIVDTGVSLGYLLENLEQRGPKSLKVCTLIDKRERRRKSVAANYAGIVCSSGFLVGYGLDLDEHYRELPDIYELVANSLCGGLNDSPM